mmetsp:Transcript_156200/g.498940  ORF Transcript_156200/g.498940 Transcript_156200/m.498940 type:complete len:249 (-) Transcript_156200:2483-3229(-)
MVPGALAARCCCGGFRLAALGRYRCLGTIPTWSIALLAGCLGTWLLPPCMGRPSCHSLVGWQGWRVLRLQPHDQPCSSAISIGGKSILCLKLMGGTSSGRWLRLSSVARQRRRAVWCMVVASCMQSRCQWWAFRITLRSATPSRSLPPRGGHASACAAQQATSGSRTHFVRHCMSSGPSWQRPTRQPARYLVPLRLLGTRGIYGLKLRLLKQCGMVGQSLCAQPRGPRVACPRLVRLPAMAAHGRSSR